MADQRKTVLITGTSSGIGESLALEFKSRGFRVFATARSTSKITHLAAKGIETFALEVQEAAQIAALKEQIASLTGGKLDYLVNNAGRNYSCPALDLDMDELQDLFATNLFAVMRMCQEFAPLLINARGTIVQVGSVAGVMPFVFSPAYNASKAALHSYSDTLRVELKPFGVRVVNIITGGVKSEIARRECILPPDSYYQPVAKEFQDRVVYSQNMGVPTSRYTKHVVDQLLGTSLWSRLLSLFRLAGPKRAIWAGSNVGTIWFIRTFMPAFILEMFFTNLGKLNRLRGTGIKKLN